MCIVFEEQFDRIGEAIQRFINENEKLEIIELEEELKDYLSDLKDSGIILHCGCSGEFKVTKENDTYFVFMEILNNVNMFTVTKDKVTRSSGSHSDLIDDYDEMKYYDGNEIKILRGSQ